MPTKKKSTEKKVARRPATKSTSPTVILLETKGGRTIRLSDTGLKVEIEDGNGNRIALSPAGVMINAATKVRVSAEAEIVLDGAIVTINAGTTKFSGTVQCDALVSNSVMSATYSPGVGNVW